MSSIVIRLDDVGWSATPIDPPPMKAPDVGLDLAQRFHRAMNGAPYLAGLIPATIRHDNAAQAWLASKPQGMTLALHGYSHEPVGTVRNEFHGMSVAQCRERLAMGRELLRIHCGTVVEHLIPPFNGLSEEMGEACALEGIKYVWGGANHNDPAPSEWGYPPPPYPWGRVTFVPSWRLLYGATRWRMSPRDMPLLDYLREHRSKLGRCVITLHITWEAAKDPDFDGVRELVDLIGPHIACPAEYAEAR